MALVVFFQSFYMLFTGSFIALGRVSLNLRIVTVESLVEASFAALLVLVGAGAAGAAFGRAIGYSAGAGFGIVLLVRLVGAANLRRGAAKGASPVSARRILGYGSALLIIDGAYALLARSAPC